MFNEEVIKALTNCPDEQLEEVIRMLEKHYKVVKEMIETLKTRETISKQTTNGICLNHPSLKEYLKSKGTSSEIMNQMFHDTFDSKEHINTNAIDTVLSAERIKYSLNQFKETRLPTWFKHMLTEKDDHRYDAMMVLKEAFIDHVRRIFPSGTLQYVAIASGGTINYLFTIDTLTIKSCIKMFDDNTSDLSCDAIASAITNEIQKAISQRNEFTYAEFLNVIKMKTRQYATGNISVSYTSNTLIFRFSFNDKVAATVSKNIKVSDKIVDFQEVDYDNYFETVIEPLFKRAVNLPEWMISHFVLHPESKFLTDIKQKFVKYILDTLEPFGNDVTEIYTDITKNILTYKLAIDGHVIRREFSLFDVDSSKAKSTSQIVNEVYDSVQSFINKHELNLINLSEHLLQNTEIINVSGVKLRVNDSLLDVIFMYNNEIVTRQSMTLSPFQFVKEPKKKPSTKAKAKKVTKKK